MTLRKISMLAITLVLTLTACPTGAAEFKDSLGSHARKVFQDNKDAIVTVQAVVSISAGGNQQENEGWANGTVLSPEGLTVLSLTFIDPTHIYQSMGQRDGMVSTEVVSLKIMRPDGDEIPAEVVLRDKHLDLAFVRPTEELEEPLPYVDPENEATPEILDPVTVIMQLGKVAQRAHSVFLTRIETVVEKPRLYYTIGEERGRAVASSPVFTLDGKFVGIGAMRAIRATGGSRGDNMLVVIVPAQDIREALEQLPAPGEEAEE